MTTITTSIRQSTRLLSTDFHLFLLKRKNKKLYRITPIGSPCYENEIDAKCAALPFNKEKQIPKYYRVKKNENLKIHKEYKELPNCYERLNLSHILSLLEMCQR